jgi:DNA-binding GntR family transcriptional regulator
MSFIGDRALPPSTVQFVIDLLRDLLMQGALEPGARIKEGEIAERLGLSRGPVREALRTLAGDGLIELLPNRGARVSTYGALDVLELYALRSHLGSLAIHKLVLQPPTDLQHRLRPLVEQLRAAAQQREERRVVELDLVFQDQLVAASGLAITERTFRRLTMRLRMVIAVLGTRYDDRLDAILAEDEVLTDLVLQGDRHEADRAWRDRLEGYVRNFIGRLPDEEFDTDLWLALATGAS